MLENRRLSILLGLTLALVACGSAPSGTNNGAAPQTSKPNARVVHVLLTNQSPITDPVDIRVAIDGNEVAKGEMAFDGGHAYRKWDVVLGPGAHDVRASSMKGDASIDAVLEGDEDERWAIVTYWNGGFYRVPKHLAFEVQTSPFQP